VETIHAHTLLYGEDEAAKVGERRLFSLLVVHGGRFSASSSTDKRRVSEKNTKQKHLTYNGIAGS